MSRFRIVYSRGSFGFVSLCDTHDQAMVEARALHRTSGVWHVHVEDEDGVKILSEYDLKSERLSRPRPARRSCTAAACAPI